MADRRMLWKTVSQSKKVNSLSVNAALLWTWCIPWFDRDGCMEAEADFLKFNVAPRRRELDESSIPALVDEIINSGLWILFRDPEGRKVVKDPKFREKQKFEYKKEVESRWASSKWEGKELEAVSTRLVIAEHSAIGRAEGKVRQGKVVEGKERECEGKPEPPKPVDNFSTEPETPKPKDALSSKTEIQIQELQDLALKVKTMFPNFRLNLFLQNHNRAHPESVLHTLRKLLDYPERIGEVKDPMALCESIIKIEDKNYNAADFYAGE
jgi:hypothetical protein